MSNPPPLTKSQKQRLATLEPALRDCVPAGNLRQAQLLAAEIKELLSPTGHRMRLLQAKNWLYETAIEAGSIAYAKAGFEGTRQLVSKGTRIYVEATALLAVCNLREQRFDIAKALIQEAVQGLPNISSEARRKQFHARLLGRLEDECILAGLAMNNEPPPTLDRVDSLAIALVQRNDQEQLTLILGQAIPKQSLDILKDVRTSYERRLPAPELKHLPPPPPNEEQREALGKRAHAAIKRIAWRSLCDPTHHVHQAWTQGLSVVYDKKYITGAILAALGSVNITGAMIIASVAALAIRMGAELFCEVFAPTSLMISRDDKS